MPTPSVTKRQWRKKESILTCGSGFVSKKSAQGLSQLIGNYCIDGDTALTRPAFPSQPFLYLTVTAATTPIFGLHYILATDRSHPMGK